MPVFARTADAKNEQTGITEAGRDDFQGLTGPRIEI
jgi:hypothetical protein